MLKMSDLQSTHSRIYNLLLKFLTDNRSIFNKMHGRFEVKVDNSSYKNRLPSREFESIRGDPDRAFASHRRESRVARPKSFIHHPALIQQRLCDLGSSRAGPPTVMSTVTLVLLPSILLANV